MEKSQAAHLCQQALARAQILPLPGEEFLRWSQIFILLCHILYNETMLSVSLSDSAAFFFFSLNTDKAFGEAHGCGDWFLCQCL